MIQHNNAHYKLKVTLFFSLSLCCSCETIIASPFILPSDVSMDPGEEESAPLVNRGRGGSQSSSSSSGPCIHVHLYFVPKTKDAATINIAFGCISAEKVCVEAGKKCGKVLVTCWSGRNVCFFIVSLHFLLSVMMLIVSSPGILPVYLSLFGLASADLSFWYPPSHMFNTEENIHVHFRVRYEKKKKNKHKGSRLSFGVWTIMGKETGIKHFHNYTAIQNRDARLKVGIKELFFLKKTLINPFIKWRILKKGSQLQVEKW